MNNTTILLVGILTVCLTTHVQAQDPMELGTTLIKGNKGNTEMPQITYIVLWQDMKQEKHKEQTLVLHSLFGDLFEPVYFADNDKPASGSGR
jgi:hypothetical protein